MDKQLNFGNITGWLFFLVLLTLGILNLILVHPVPGIIYLFLSLIFIPPTNPFLQKKFGFSIPWALKVILGIVIVWFTLGISDLAEIFGL